MGTDHFRTTAAVFLIVLTVHSGFTKYRLLRLSAPGGQCDVQTPTGPQFPDCILPDREGRRVDVRREAAQHRLTVVMFWASFCAPCIEKMPGFVEFCKAHEQDEDLLVVSINVDVSDESRELFLAEHPLPFPVLLDPTCVVLESMTSRVAIPEILILNQHGQVIARPRGIDALEGVVRTWLK